MAVAADNVVDCPVAHAAQQIRPFGNVDNEPDVG
jgi:hypothetical protein